MTRLRQLVRREEGASLLEYALLVGLIAAACVAGVVLLGDKLEDLFTRLARSA
jgi:pilus assembly protein Flp/PilA